MHLFNHSRVQSPTHTKHEFSKRKKHHRIGRLKHWQTGKAAAWIAILVDDGDLTTADDLREHFGIVEKKIANIKLISQLQRLLFDGRTNQQQSSTGVNALMGILKSSAASPAASVGAGAVSLKTESVEPRAPAVSRTAAVVASGRSGSGGGGTHYQRFDTLPPGMNELLFESLRGTFSGADIDRDHLLSRNELRSTLNALSIPLSCLDYFGRLCVLSLFLFAVVIF